MCEKLINVIKLKICNNKLSLSKMKFEMSFKFFKYFNKFKIKIERFDFSDEFKFSPKFK